MRLSAGALRSQEQRRRSLQRARSAVHTRLGNTETGGAAASRADSGALGPVRLDAPAPAASTTQNPRAFALIHQQPRMTRMRSASPPRTGTDSAPSDAGSDPASPTGNTNCCDAILFCIWYNHSVVARQAVRLLVIALLRWTGAALGSTLCTGEAAQHSAVDSAYVVLR